MVAVIKEMCEKCENRLRAIVGEKCEGCKVPTCDMSICKVRGKKCWMKNHPLLPNICEHCGCFNCFASPCNKGYGW